MDSPLLAKVSKKIGKQNKYLETLYFSNCAVYFQRIVACIKLAIFYRVQQAWHGDALLEFVRSLENKKTEVDSQKTSIKDKISKMTFSMSELNTTSKIIMEEEVICIKCIILKDI